MWDLRTWAPREACFVCSNGCGLCPSMYLLRHVYIQWTDEHFNRCGLTVHWARYGYCKSTDVLWGELCTGRGRLLCSNKCLLCLAVNGERYGFSAATDVVSVQMCNTRGMISAQRRLGLRDQLWTWFLCRDRCDLCPTMHLVKPGS